MKSRYALLGIPLLTAVLALPAFAQRGDRDRPEIPLLTVNGTGEARVSPDLATVRLGITRQAPTAQAAQSQVNEVAQAIIAAVLRTGVDRKQVQTSQLTLHPIYAPQKPDNPVPPTIVAYRATNVVTVRVEELSKSGQVIDAGLKAGANELQGIAFGLKDDNDAREKALRLASREAQSKARVLADSLGVRLGPVHEIQEGGVSIQQPFYGGAMFARAADAGTPVAPGEITVNATVTVRYRFTQ
jgi:uncharacterized protein YggE